MKRSETFGSFAKAFSQFQNEVTNPKMTADNPYFKSKYAPLDEILKLVRPILSKYGLSVFQDVATHEERHDHVVITTTIFHESGEFLESNALILPGFQKLKNGEREFNAQGAGSSISYAKRYQLQAALGIAADSDEDGDQQNHDREPLHVPSNMISTPSQATLRAKYQLVMKKSEGFDEYCQGLRDKGHDDKYIAAALDKAHEVQKKQTKPA